MTHKVLGYIDMIEYYQPTLLGSYFMAEITSDTLIELALDLTTNLTAKDRFTRLLATVKSTITCDAVVLLSVTHETLKPLSQLGLSPDVLGRRFDIHEHPRLSEICRAKGPVRFSADSPLPDPYDGMLLTHSGVLPVHACMGLPLFSGGKLIGMLTLDSMTPKVFDDIPERTLAVISAMSAAALKTAMLLEQLERDSRHTEQVVVELTNEALTKDGGELIGNSGPMIRLKADINLVASSEFTVLIQGETGVGKELVARTLHQQSRRNQGPLVYVNCAALPENLVESELFGHVKGAFTGAEKNRRGKFSLAHHGTLFLDEVGELPLPVQSKLLRALQNKEIQAVGCDRVETVDVRVIAATNRILEHEVDAGRFRADLYHRLSVYPILVPPLRTRGNDITELAGYFSEQIRRKLGYVQITLSPSALNKLNRYHWPGNVRELEHVISRAALRARAKSERDAVKIEDHDIEHLISGVDSPGSMNSNPSQRNHQSLAIGEGLKIQTELFQRDLIRQALHMENNNWAAAARRLDIDRSNLIRTAKRLGVEVQKHLNVSDGSAR